MRRHDDPRQCPPFLRLSCFLLVIVATARVYADDLDVSAFEFVDVIETAEGSVLRGVVTEQTPNVTYKLATADGSVHVIRAASVVKVSKQRNPRYRVARAVAALPPPIDDEPAAIATYAPRSGLRLAPELAIAMPSGDLVNIAGTPLSYRASFSQGASLGYERVSGTLGLGVGGLARFTQWRLPVEVETAGSHWTFETQLYGRASLLSLGRAVPYAGIALGLDTNHTYNNANGASTTMMSFGMNVQAGVSITATRSLALDIGIDLHPGTDEIEPGVGASVSYYAVRLGALFRL
jgi:hypothetical protein